MRMPKTGVRVSFAFFLCGATLSGCATFNGQPEPVVSTATSEAVLKNYPIETVWSEYSKKDGELRRAYRNEVIYAYMQGIDARYYDFRGALGRQRKGGDLAFDGLLLGLGAAGSLWTKAADEILAGTTALVGGRGAIDRNLYFEKTLPALLATMDAERFRIATALQDKLASDTSEYPLGAALLDLQAYQLAGTLDNAASQINDAAASDRKDAKRDFDRSVRYACDPSVELISTTRKIRNAVAPIARAARAERDAGVETARQDALRQIAPFFGASGSVEDIMGGITLALNQDFCSVEKLKNLGAKLKQALPAEPTLQGF